MVLPSNGVGRLSNCARKMVLVSRIGKPGKGALTPQTRQNGVYPFRRSRKRRTGALPKVVLSNESAGY